MGECDSACTMFLSVPNVCVAPTARLGFHRAKSNVAWVADYFTEVIWNLYPDGVKAKLGELTDKVVYLRGDEIDVPKCGAETR